MNLEKVSQLIRELLIEIGEDPQREGLLKTPDRVARAFFDLTKGYRQNPEDIINKAVFASESNNMIVARDIEVYSMCEHHMLPFYGRCHVGYIAKDKVLGLSKIQERLTAQIAEEIMNAVDAEGVGVVMECRHLCMMMRGVEKQNSVMTTSSVLGSIHDEPETRTEFLTLINRSFS
jgi:GTP cyclohydrolase I